MGSVSRRRPDQRPLTRRVSTKVPDRYLMFIAGEISVEDLDDEEIFRGQLRNKSGSFAGRPPNYVPREFAIAVQHEAARRFMAEIGGLVPESLAAVQRVLEKRHPQPGDGATVQAAFKVLERFAGRVPETLRLDTGKVSKWDESVQQVIQEEIIDAEIVEEEP